MKRREFFKTSVLASLFGTAAVPAQGFSDSSSFPMGAGLVSMERRRALAGDMMYANASILSMEGISLSKEGLRITNMTVYLPRKVKMAPSPNFTTRFRDKLEAEVRTTMSRLPSDTVKILLNDGGTNLWNYADTTPLYDGFERIIDFHHVLEHISSGAEGIFGKGTKEGKAWYRKMERTLLSYEDGSARVIHSLEYYAKAYEYSPTSLKLIEDCLTFMRNNSDRMEYKRFRDNGWPIGSGPVEGSCKDIVKKRMCQSGQRSSVMFVLDRQQRALLLIFM